MPDDAIPLADPIRPGAPAASYPAESPGAGAAPRRPKGVRETPMGALRPREKLLRFGPGGLNQSELLAVLLGTGTKGRSVVRIAEDLVSAHGGQGLLGLSLKDWSKERGVGRVKAAQMLAAFELGRRLLAPQGEEPRVSSPAEAYTLVRDLKKARKEHLVALYLDAQNRLICRETVSIGSLNTTRTHPREVLQPAIVNSALAFVLVHNHPSGSLDPSRDDVEFTRTMARAGDLMGISLYDHLIVSRRGFVSLKERGLV
jgi:DNA repair protein RadC